ncbi:NAD(P)/FAD-dependent oxidoreductase [Pseudomonas sediminis]|uniref:flavin-containing monooxygenase n=1 Tax=Pseudomonas TaxID=286 RepID=UPI000CADFAD9|nr:MULTISPECIES: NAD(P)/FAD-dependent oxidoreductase [Pseudomonas]MDG9759414.1 NAD(P)/FAD-dependent oxidoreductase [Pseudomonas sediminis]PKQ42970.1 4-hydroxyacetophenone monooxygenase [Pseudomonas sp. YY-1]
MNAPVSPPTAARHCKIAILGSGFSGLGMAIRLKQQGEQDFLLFEKEAGVGGTWRVNNYPGCGCDVQSHLYSFSFEPNPNWTRMFARQPEITAYLQGCWEKYRLQDKTLLDTEVVQMRWDEHAERWHLLDRAGNQYSAQFVVSGMGALSTPSIPKLKGLENFTGEVFHSQQWNHDYDLTCKRVAVIGTGASAIQFVPQIQKQVAQLDLYQRTAPWIMPKPDRAIRDDERERFKRFPLAQKLWRGALYSILESRVIAFAFAPRLLRMAQGIAKLYINKQIKDPVLRAKVTPDYTMGCKRVLISNDYYPALVQPNVEVITDSVTEILPHGVRTADGQEREVDAIIFGTGFTPSDPLPRGTVFGRGGIDLLDTWPEGPEAYKGTMTAGFPNLFFLMGPNTGLGHNSMVYMIESQITYVLGALKQLEEGQLQSLEPKREAQDAFNRKIQGTLGSTVWNTGGCMSWYLHPVSGRNCTVWPGFTWRYRMLTRHFDPPAYHFSRKQAAHPAQSNAIALDVQETSA